MDWRFSTFLLFLFALLLGSTWATSQDGLCHSKFVLDVLALQNKDGALNCFDFWLNRYQTLIAALIAGAIALWAGRLLFRQVEAQRFDFFARQLVDLRRIRASADELNAICNGKIGPDVKIRISGERNKKSYFAIMFEAEPEEFSEAVKRAREKLIQLEASSRQPIGPSTTARQAEVLAQAVAEYLRYCEVDALVRGRARSLASQFGLGPLPATEPDLIERSPGTREQNIAVCDAYNELARVFELELTQIAEAQARAHSAVR